MKTGIELIAAERQEQIEKHGYDLNHDLDFEMDGKLIMAAQAAILGNDAAFPASWEIIMVQKICDKPLKERLIIAGALIAAEIDRLQYSQNENKEA